jgi:hypothetical protein
LFQIRVGKNDVGRLATKLERDTFQVAGGNPHDALADFRRTGE